jgi:hypothetical protein
MFATQLAPTLLAVQSTVRDILNQTEPLFDRKIEYRFVGLGVIGRRSLGLSQTRSIGTLRVTKVVPGLVRHSGIVG